MEEGRTRYKVTSAKVDVYQVNIQGMITLHNNKSKFLRKTIDHGNNKKKILAVTETWANKNFDAEYKNAFQGYNVSRNDRKEKTGGSTDEDHLEGRGGVMILTSAEIPITPVGKFSNGNCEVVIVHLKTINMVLAVMYRPSGSNFSLSKYNEAICFLETEMMKLKEQHDEVDMMLMGDFNFPIDIVQWIKTNYGLLANATGRQPATQGYR